jgi:hypothetical protein
MSPNNYIYFDKIEGKIIATWNPIDKLFKLF